MCLFAMGRARVYPIHSMMGIGVGENQAGERKARNALMCRAIPVWWSMLLLAMTACTGPSLEPTPRGTAVPATATAAATAVSTAMESCVNDAAFVEDLTVPDSTVVAPGQSVDKQWAVTNNGTCDWGADHRLRPIAGNPLVSGRAEALYPARAGAAATWRVTFEAPTEPGEYIGEWQAFDPAGTPFGDTVFLVLEVGGE